MGFLAGAGLLRLADQFLPHLYPYLPMEQAEGVSTTWERTTLLVLPITLHNIPEGLAVGVAFGAAAFGADLGGASFAGVVEEFIPEAQQEGHPDLATSASMIGFTAMMILDVALG